MKAQKPATINEIIERTRSIVANDVATIKTAAEKEIVKIPRTSEGNAIRAIAASLKSFSMPQEKLAAMKNILEGVIPTDMLESTNTKLAEINISKGNTTAETLKNTAAAIRQLGSQIKQAAFNHALNDVRALIATEKLQQKLG